MSVGQVGRLRPGGDSNDRENSSINLWGSAGTRSGRTLVAHIGDRNPKIKPFPVREGVPTAIVSVLFAPMLSPGCSMGGRSLVEDENCCTETYEGENGEKTENSVDEDIYTAERLCVMTEFGEETAGVHHNVWLR